MYKKSVKRKGKLIEKNTCEISITDAHHRCADRELRFKHSRIN